MWHYRLVTDTGAIEIYPLPDASSDDDYTERGRIIAALNERHGVPEDWFESGAGWDVACMEGTLHPTLLANATLHDASEVPTDKPIPEEPAPLVVPTAGNTGEQDGDATPD